MSKGRIVFQNSDISYFFLVFFDRIFRKFMGSDQNWAKRRNFCTYKDLNRKNWQENREIYVRQWKNREVLGFSFIAISFISSLGVTRNSMIGPDNVVPTLRGWGGGQPTDVIIGFPDQ